MAGTASNSLPQQRNVVLIALLVLASAAWALLIWQSTVVGEKGMGPTMMMEAPVFLLIWVVMMVAMMFPTAAPMLLMFQRVQAGKRPGRQPFGSTSVFVVAYLIVWILFGGLAYLVATGGQFLAESWALPMDVAARTGGGVLLLAGIYQLSPLKNICLSKCRTPVSFILTSWRDGFGGALRMGLEHGTYCLGCCWLLFVILFPLGMMNVGAMALITLLIFAEKSLPFGRRIGQFADVGLTVYGLLVLLAPEMLPILTPPMSGI